MPTAWRAAFDPMPEFSRIWGVPILPADKITSFFACAVILGPASM
jgi:hypothetical protein